MVGHYISFVNVEELAEVMHTSLGEGLRQAMEEDTLWKHYDSEKSDGGGLVVSGKWLKRVRKLADARRSITNKLGTLKMAPGNEAPGGCLKACYC